MFACLSGNGVGLRLPVATATELQFSRDNVGPFSPGGVASTREWIQIERADPADYAKDLELFQPRSTSEERPALSGRLCEGGRGSSPAGPRLCRETRPARGQRARSWSTTGARTWTHWPRTSFARDRPISARRAARRGPATTSTRGGARTFRQRAQAYASSYRREQRGQLRDRMLVT